MGIFVIEKLNEIIKLLKDEGTSSKLKESSTLPNSYQTTPPLHSK